jgi:uncharacterized membrane protein
MIYVVILLSFLLVLLIRWLSNKLSFFKFIGPVITSFLAGLILSSFISIELKSSTLFQQFFQFTVPIGIVLMLLSADVIKSFRFSGKIILSFFLQIISVVTMSVTAYFLFSNQITHSEDLSALLTGVYIGGTPNMSGIKMAIGSPDTIFRQAFLSDIFHSSIYLILVMVVAKRLLKKILSPYKNELSAFSSHQQKDKKNIKWSVYRMFLSIGIALMISAIPIAVTFIIDGNLSHLSMLWMMLSITVVAIFCSFIPSIRSIQESYPTGDFLFTLFFLYLGMNTSFSELMQMESNVLMFTGMVLFGSFILHLIFAYIFRIDTDTFLITSAAGIMSPPFIPSMANVLGNKDILVPAMAVSIIGLAVGNVLGTSVFLILSNL